MIGPFEQDVLYHGDALLLLPSVPSGVADLVITDPPFAIDFRAKRLNYNRTGGNVLEGYREIPADEYPDFTRRWMKEVHRILKPSGSLYVFSGWNRLRDILEGLDEAGFSVINHIIWKYQFGVFTTRRFVTSHYHILFAARDPRSYCFNKVDHYPEDVWEIKREYWKGRRKTPTKLPPALVRKIIEYSSNPGDLILDPFIGSGTVAVVSRDAGRHFIGFEIVDEYLAFAQERLAAGSRENGSDPLADARDHHGSR